MPTKFQTSIILTILTASLLTYITPSIQRRLLVLGIAYTSTRPQAIITVTATTPKDKHPEVHFIEDTIHCEDLHYLPLTNEIITACEDDDSLREKWFPGLGHYDVDPDMEFKGSLHVIDAVTLKSKRLKITNNFPGPFVTHGLDVIPDPKTKDGYFIYAVNHLPHPAYTTTSRSSSTTTTKPPKARSQIELFHYISGSNTVQYIRSIRHDLITTPNDIHAIDGNSFYVTNDHRYRDGLLRQYEDVITAAKWSSTIYVKFETDDGDYGKRYDAGDGVQASIALTGIHNNNGMGRGGRVVVMGKDGSGKQEQNEVLVTSAGSGIFYRVGQRPISSSSSLTKKGGVDDTNKRDLVVLESIPIDSSLDNPSYFVDLYPHLGGGDSTGYILCGLGEAVEFISHIKDREHMASSLVWHVSKNATSGDWIKRLVFEDDGSLIRGATTAVMVPIDPKLEGGVKRGWLFIASVVGKSVIAVKIDLSDLHG